MAQDTPRPVGRPQKADAERLVPLSVNVTPEMYAALCRMAQARSVALSTFCRTALEHTFRPVSQLEK